MNDHLRNDYEEAKRFWNTAFTMDETEKKDAETAVDKENGWKEMAPSEKLCTAVSSLGSRRKVLDYGCGRGWAAIIAAKGGCMDVTGVELAENAVNSAEFYAKLYEVDDRVTFHHISEEWISQVAPESFDGIVCSNVLDVVPGEVAEGIIENLARIAEKDAAVVIGLNYYMEPKANPERNMTVKNGNHVYLNSILRLVCRTDEDWTELFSRYFKVERLEHFAWPGEETERRRLFCLRKR